MAFIIYDLVLLFLFLVFISIFLYTRKKNLKKEGLLILYKTSWGIKLINYVGNKYKRSLKVLSYISICLGYALMAGIIYLIYTIFKVYIFRPDIVSEIKVPPIMPLIPYIDKIVPGLPKFYFTYWIIIIAVIAITHEFAHGIFASLNKIKIKNTGFGFFPFFLPIFLAAFVELDEKKMHKKNKFSQMSILSSGTFANIITAVFFFIVIWIFFSLAYTPSGVFFDDYSYSIVGISSITSINNITLSNPSYDKITELTGNKTLNDIKTKDKKYSGIKGFSNDLTKIALYDDAPAINVGLIPGEVITEINGIKIYSKEKLAEELLKYSPGEKITLKIYDGEDIRNHDVILGKNPQNENMPFLGIGFFNEQRTGIIGKSYSFISSYFKEPNIYYKSKIGEVGEFIYLLFWWLILISVSVALINMLPVGIFDGGRFFYLTILGITKNEKIAKKTFSLMTYLFLFLLLMLMIFWIISFIR